MLDRFKGENKWYYLAGLGAVAGLGIYGVSKFLADEDLTKVNKLLGNDPRKHPVKWWQEEDTGDETVLLTINFESADGKDTILIVLFKKISELITENACT